MIYVLFAAVAGVLLAFVFDLFDVNITGETELPVGEGDVSDLTGGMRTEDMTDPDVDVDVSTEKAEVEVPTVLVNGANAEAEENNCAISKA